MIREPRHRADERTLWVVDLGEVDRTRSVTVGGKGANLGELLRIDGVSVPAGFCVTTGAYRRILADVPSIDAQFDHLARLRLEDRDALHELTAQIRRGIARVSTPSELEQSIADAILGLGEELAYAVRSSATAEDLPTASSAGQQDSYLDVVGVPAILEHIRRCWTSLFTERAVTYRIRNHIDHRTVEMAVIVQQMVEARSSGVLFTADPVTGHRQVASIEATFGLSDALASGTVNPDRYEVRHGNVVGRTVATQGEPALTEHQVLDLVALGRRIEASFGYPQDIEWCLDEHGFQIVQSRPITTLFPIPEVDDGAKHVFVSVGHGQMMTDPMTPLGLSVWQLTSPAPTHIAGGRLYVDVTARLSSTATRPALLETFGRSDPLIRDALETVLERGDVIPAGTDQGPVAPREASPPPPTPDVAPAEVAELVDRTRASVAELQREITGKTGSELFDFILDDIAELRTLLFDPLSHQAVMTGMEAAWWLNDRLHEWLGERNPVDDLSLAAPGNVTAEMGLALLDVADVIRPHTEAVMFLRSVRDDGVFDRLTGVPGGSAARDAIAAYLDTYGMRCIGEIDIGRPRWRERPSALLPVLLSNVDNFEHGEHERRVERDRRRAQRKQRELLRRLRGQPDGAQRADQTERMIGRLRAFIGYREYPKYGMVCRYAIYRQALLAEARRLVERGVLELAEDICFLAFHELHDVARTGKADPDLIARRRLDFRCFGALAPPRVLTSDGEALNGAYRRDDVPVGALVGLAASGGTVEGRARVIHDMAEADLEPGDILVTAHTDPSWSPLFVTVAGLVTEAGGLMTHGAVVAREYGLAAVVGVEHATRAIRDGERIRISGNLGYVEFVDAAKRPRWLRRTANTTS
jgi:pyruvate,water dikinase